MRMPLGCREFIEFTYTGKVSRGLVPGRVWGPIMRDKHDATIHVVAP